MVDSEISEVTEDILLAQRVAELELQLARLEEVESEKRAALALPGKAVLHRVIASKVSEGYQLEFVMLSGEVHFGFPIGLDDEWVQIYCTGHGQVTGPNFYKDTSHDVDKPWRKWLQLVQIESLEENFFGVRHLNRESRERLDNERKGMLRRSRAYLYGPDNRNRRG